MWHQCQRDWIQHQIHVCERNLNKMEILRTPFKFSTLQHSNFWLSVYLVSALQDNDALWEMDAAVLTLWIIELAF